MIELYQTLLASPVFKEWQKDESYLTHFYHTLDSNFNLTGPWEVGFYNPKTDQITIFVVDQEVSLKPAEEVFKKEGEVEKLDLDQVKIDLDQALAIFQQTQQEHHSKEILLNGFLILQKFQNKIIWNISFATKSINILNIKINAQDGKVISHQAINFMESKAS